jgi:hypothetical protein
MDGARRQSRETPTCDDAYASLHELGPSCARVAWSALYKPERYDMDAPFDLFHANAPFGQWARVPGYRPASEKRGHISRTGSLTEGRDEAHRFPCCFSEILSPAEQVATYKGGCDMQATRRTSGYSNGFAAGTLASLAQTGCQWRLLPKDFPPYTEGM